MSIESRLDCLVRGKSEVKAYVGGCPSAIVDIGAGDAFVDMRRRWSNNGGFQTLRMLEESSSEVTSSSALGLPPAMVMSPESLASPEYGGLELWSYDDGISYNTATAQLLGNACTMQQQQPPTQPLPSMPLPMPPTTPKSENESMSSGREELSPASSVNGCSTDGDARRQKKGPAPRQQEELCLVCGDRASGYHYNALTCEGCKGFFRRSVTKNAVYICKFGHACEMDMYMRRKCQECRLKKCLAVGMRPECVVPETQCAIKRKEKKAQREKDKLPVSTTTVDDHMPPIMQCDPPPPEAARILECLQHEVVPRFLSDKLMEQNRLKNIPPLTANQQFLIARLVWYQDGYEQPSEEDLKRVTQTWQPTDEDDDDMPFRQITEMTILTVQLIVEFAKGLPGFSKISQPDQITLLKACSSEVMMLRVARRYDAATDSVLFANNQAYTRDNYRKAGMAYVIEDLLHFCRCMYSMTMDNVHYALLTAIVIFSDRPGLEQPQLVEEIQRYYLNTLRVYIMNQHSDSPRCAVVFGKILSVLTEIRTLGMQNSNMCISLKLKNRKLPPFLEEIWDVADVSTAQQLPLVDAGSAL
ncbi:ecdysone receptor isoform X1 [Plodia interpunctella]|uniref:ecdysone receptor isoform X1 n=1 Tax=Plodia interpunctella TaxID=58824 RepID=UPI002368AA4C|nr:ecdysone receptor isoform X1 [Plodia interpunctella]